MMPPYRINNTGHLVDFGQRRVTDHNDRVVRLTGAQWEVLCILLENRGSVVSREEISARALFRDYSPFERSVDVLVSALRRKLKGDAYLIQSARRIGYVMPLQV